MESDRKTITLVEKQKSNKYRCNIYLDGEYAFSVHEDIMIKHRLLKGEVIEQARMAVITSDDERHQAYLEAIRFIGRRPRSEKETHLYLQQKGYDPMLIADAVRLLREQHYLDDGQFAKLWTEHRVLSQKKGRKLVEMELSQKGLSGDEIRQALGTIDAEEEYSAALELGRKKWKTLSGTAIDRKRKVMAFLLRRGYPNEAVNRVLRRLSDDATSMEEED